MSSLLLRFSLVVIFVYFLLVLFLVKKKKFSLRYGLLWLFSGFAMLIFILFPNILECITGMLGIELASNGIFAMCIFFIILFLVFLTVVVTDFSYRIRKLAQQAAIVEKRLRDLEQRGYEEKIIMHETADKYNVEETGGFDMYDKNRKRDFRTEKLLATYPRKQPALPKEYQKIYVRHYKENREGKTKISALARKFEKWIHVKVAKSARGGVENKTLEIGAGTLNQLDYERPKIYDIVEPFRELYVKAPNLKYVRNIYQDITDVKNEKYDRITSIACFEHVENLPEMVYMTTKLLKKGGKLCISIPNEGRFLWKFSYTVTTGREFERRYGLKYETMMRHEHINTADEIEQILKYYYKKVNVCFFGIGKTFSMFRYFECSEPERRRCTTGSQ